MLNTCLRCGAYRVDKIIDPTGPFAVCPECGHKHLFRYLPLFLVSGASAVGMSTAGRMLAGQLEEVILMDSDILWRSEFDKPQTKYRDYFEIWLRVAKNIAQSGRPVVLFGAGMSVPENIEPCLERRYFSKVYYLALTCDPEVQRERYSRRPSWRSSKGPEFLETHIQFNRWFRENADKVTPAIDLVDTTHASPAEASQRVAEWVREKLAQNPGA